MESSTVVVCVLFFLAVHVSHAPCTCEVDVDWMQQTLTQHFSQARHHVTNATYKKQTMEFIRDQFRDMGLECHLDIFPTEVANVMGVNVIGLLKGRHFNTDQDRVMGIGAHYDTMRNTPGVDDNGSGMVVMLQAARELASKPIRDYTIIFIAFDFEEWESSSESLVACQHLSCGSRHLVEHWIPSFFKAPVTFAGLFVLETIMNFDETDASQSIPMGLDVAFPTEVQNITSDGSDGDFLTVVGRKGEDEELVTQFNTAWTQLGAAQYEIEWFILPSTGPEFGDFLRSDHKAFWDQGYKAVFITDTADFRGYMKQCYHEPCDQISSVTPGMLQFAAKTCRSLISVLDSMSPGTGTTASPGQTLRHTRWLLSAVTPFVLLAYRM